MHHFPELVNNCASFTLRKLQVLQMETIDQLQFSGATILVKTLQMIRLEKAIQLIGTFSLFDALLQERLNCNNGIKEAKFFNSTKQARTFGEIYRCRISYKCSKAWKR